MRPNPRDTLVYEGISLCRKEKVDFVLAVGGGSVIDSAKAIAAGVPYDGDFWDFYQGKFVEEALPIGTVLTIAAAGSEGSPDSVVTKEEGQFKRDAHGEVLRPKFSILNPALTQTLPPYQTAWRRDGHHRPRARALFYQTRPRWKSPTGCAKPSSRR